MKELTKVNDSIFSECYAGENGNTRVIVILDDRCVRYTVLKRKSYTAPWKKTSRREFGDHQKAACMEKAVAALNKKGVA